MPLALPVLALTGIAFGVSAGRQISSVGTLVGIGAAAYLFLKK